VVFSQSFWDFQFFGTNGRRYIENFLPKPECKDKMPKNGTQGRLFFHIPFQPSHSLVEVIVRHRHWPHVVWDLKISSPIIGRNGRTACFIFTHFSLL